MGNSCRKFFCISAFLGIMLAGCAGTEDDTKIDIEKIEYKDGTGVVTDEEKEVYKELDLESAMQQAIQSMGYGSDAQVDIQDYDFHSKDNQDAIVKVMLSVAPDEDVLEEEKADIENFVIRCMEGISPDNIMVYIENVDDVK